MHGFSAIQYSNAQYDQGAKAVVATKQAFKAGGTSLKNRKKKAAAASTVDENANPWGNLNGGATGESAALINEDTLMGDETKEKAMTSQFAGDCDRIMPGKACADCTCGLKEVLEGNITKD